LVFEESQAHHYMKKRPSDAALRMAAIILAAMTLYIPRTAEACAACFGSGDSTGVGGGGPGGPGGPMNAAIFLMLGCIGGVLSLLCAFAIYLYKRSQAPIPPHVQLAELIGSQSK
jgi:hypothetical protein